MWDLQFLRKCMPSPMRVFKDRGSEREGIIKEETEEWSKGGFGGIGA